MIENLTFDQLPNAVTKLTKEFSELKSFLLQKQEEKQQEPQEQLLTVQQTADFLSLSKATIYSKVSRGELPVMKRGKRLYFSNTELMEYLKEGRTMSNLDVEAEANKYILNSKS